ncbi:MAG: SgcJ/EcaC family oxidoreductase [Candidatus Acidiferrales bacterium]
MRHHWEPGHFARLIGSGKRALWLASAIFGGFASIASAQSANVGAIRVESNEVLVPVVIEDKSAVSKLHNMNPLALATEFGNYDFTRWEGIFVRNLSAADFQVLDNGKEQKIDRVSFDNAGFTRDVRDNVGSYWQFIGIGGGTWSFPADDPSGSGGPGVANNSVFFNVPQYLISYSSDTAPDGQCHHVTIKVDRRKARTFARNEYCDATRSAPDPLSNTALGKQFQKFLVSKKKGKFPMSIAAIPLFTSAGGVRVRVVLDFHALPLVTDCSRSRRVANGVMVAIYKQDGPLAARLSDLLPGDNVLAALPTPPGCTEGFRPPSQYQAHIQVPAGRYELRAIARIGRKFGRAQATLDVPNTEPKSLAIGGIALIRRFRSPSAGVKDSPNALPLSYHPLVVKGVEVTPTADTHLKKGGPFNFYLQVYEPRIAGHGQPTVKLHLRIRDLKTNKIVQTLNPANAAPYATPGNPIISIGGGINISKLANGFYRLQAQATDSTGAATPWRSVNFMLTGARAGAAQDMIQQEVTDDMARAVIENEDRAAIEQTLQRFFEAWGAHDARALAMTFTTDADFTNVAGVHAHGRTKVETFDARMFATVFKGSHQTGQLHSIRFLTPDLAAVDVDWQMTGARYSDRKPQPGRKGLMNWVMAKQENGSWLIQVFHNAELGASPAITK